jgi:hypothetical protein
MPDDSRGSNRKVINLRIPLNDFEALEAFARRTERSINAAAVFAIREYIAAEDRKTSS